jgi:glutamate--cysteine ligase catalytic subunit
LLDTQNNTVDVHEEYDQFTIAEIMTGTKNMPGICTLVDQYLDEKEISETTRQILKDHVNLIRGRATGERITGATWIRNFVLDHPSYQHNSVVSEEITFDLLKKIRNLDSSQIQ